MFRALIKAIVRVMDKSLISVNTFYDYLQGDNSVRYKVLRVMYPNSQNGNTSIPSIVLEHHGYSIPSTIHFDLKGKFSCGESSLSSMMITSGVFAKNAQALGINRDDTIIVYDDFGNFCASRVWFMFRAMGHKKVLVLDGGFPAWLHASLPIQKSSSLKTYPKGNFTAEPDENFSFVGQDFILENINTQSIPLLDARSNMRFSAQEPETRPNLRSGHIPHSVNMHYASIQDQKACFVDTDTLAKVFARYSKDELIFTCGSGITACILAQAAYECGLEKLKVYDGSWSEWGANHLLPIFPEQA